MSTVYKVGQNKMIKLAIVGSRSFEDYDFFKKKIDDWIEKYGRPHSIISGGAKGTDTLASKLANEKNIPLEVHYPDYDKYLGKIAPLMRNIKIAESCTHMIAFPSKNGSGTQHAISQALKLKKEVITHFID